MMPLGQYMGPSISFSSIFVLFLSFLHKERNPVKAGSFQAATLFFMMQATVDIMDTMNPMPPIKKDGCSQKGFHRWSISHEFLVYKAATHKGGFVKGCNGVMRGQNCPFASLHNLNWSSGMSITLVLS